MCSDRDRWKKAAEDLWQLLDDISTASDMFKPTSLEGYKAFYRYTMKRCKERGKILESRDGYTLCWPDDPDDGSSTVPIEIGEEHPPMKFNVT